MKKIILICSFLLFSFTAHAEVKLICDSNGCHNHVIYDVGGGNYLVDGEMHNARSIGGDNYLIDGEMHNIRSLSNDSYLIDGEYMNVR